MGTLRLLLALAVVVAHVQEGGLLGLPFFGGTAYQAVSCFFIISGFYMALVLQTKYRNNTRAFYRARIIRLFPIYAFAFVLFFGLQSAAALVGKPMGVWSAIGKNTFSGPEYAWVIVANLTGLGSDAVLLWSAVTGSALKELLVLPVVWSLGIEITFYLLAPFILLRSRVFLLLLFIAACGLRWAVSWSHDFDWTSWNYYFFPTNLCFFLAGALAWFGADTFGLLRAKFAGWLAWMVLVAVVVWGSVFFNWQLVGVLYALFALLVGPVFMLTKDWGWDRAIGELSYPVYLIHWGLLSVYAPLRHIVPESAKVYFIVVASVLLSLVFLQLESRIKSSVCLARLSRP
jgi:peptidoglycan/LPS O-acetylase OafA/YrhL